MDSVPRPPIHLRAAVLIPAAMATLAMLGWVRHAARADAAPVALARGDVALEFAHGGRNRTAILLPPEGTPPAGGWPLVLLLHGAGGSAEQVLRTTGWRDVAARERFAIVAADGTTPDASRRARFLGNMRTWNSGTGSGLSTAGTTAFTRHVDDVGYLVALLDSVARRLRIDPSRVYVAGHSNGAGMSYRLAAEHPARFAAVGVMAGHLLADAGPTITPAVPLLHIVGDQDPLVPMSGGRPRVARGSGVTLRPALESPSRWARMLGISTPPRIVRDDSVTLRQWGPAAGGATVLSYVVKGHGHGWLWPSGGDGLPARLVGPTRHALNATETLWSFFAQQQQRRTPR